MVAHKNYNYETSPRKIVEPIKKENKNVSKKVYKKVKTSVREKLTCFMCVSVFFAVIFGLCYQYSLINEKFNDIQKLKKEYIAIEAKNTQLDISIQNSLDLKAVERYAKDKLGMQKPEKNQIVYIDIEKQDKVEISEVASLDGNENQSFFGKIANILN